MSFLFFFFQSYPLDINVKDTSSGLTFVRSIP
jgi:hypothetical protein